MLRLRPHVVSFKWLSLLTGVIVLFLMGDLDAAPTVWSQQAPANAVAPNAVGSAFSYQGRLSTSAGPATGSYDFQFTLYDAESSGNAIGSAQTRANISVTDGVFMVQLDFGPGAFPGTPRWLEVAVRQVGNGNFETLTPRQPLTPAPYAIYADMAGSVPWSGIGGIPAGFQDSTDDTGISGVTAGAGLIGGGTTGNVTLSFDFSATGTVAGNGLKITSNASTGSIRGLWGRSNSNIGYGVYGENFSSAPIPIGTPTGYATGVYGTSNASGGRGVEGNASNNVGASSGVLGFTEAATGFGVYGRNNALDATTDCCAWGVYGYSDAVDGTGVEGYVESKSGLNWGVAGFVESPAGTGVYGETYAGATSGTGKCCAAGVYGLSRAVGGIGVRGWATNTVGLNYGVAGYTESATGAGVYGRNYGGGFAGKFDGSVDIGGTLTKRGGSFKIDHPLDPENKYLYHSFVESPDMMNIYNGNVALDSNGEAWVQMPAWFEALNMEFRYQLTAIGAPGPNLYIAQKITNNQFKIAGGQAGMEVSWLVTGIRNDPYARAHRIVVEEEKPPSERGLYLAPTEYGQPETSGLNYRADQPEVVKLPAKRHSIAPDINASQVITDNH